MARSLLVLLATALLGVGAAGCGSGAAPASHTSTSAAAQGAPRHDRDDDGDNNDDDAHVLYYGHAAVGAERQAIIALVTHYYAALAAEDGAKACSLLMPFVAESVAEDYGHQPGLHGRTCAVVMSKFLARRHRLLRGESATLKFVVVRVEGGKALSVLSFAVLPEVRQIAERRDGNRWKVLSLFDGILE